MRRLAHFVVLTCLLFVAMPAHALTVAVVDFQRAVNETTEGKDAQKRLDTMYGARKSEIERLNNELKAEVKDFEARAMILSEDARAEAEQSLMMKQQRFEGTYMQYQQEMQQMYMTLLQDLDEKMRRMSETIAKEKGYDVVLDKAAVVYAGGAAVDMTDELITRYNSSN